MSSTLKHVPSNGGRGQGVSRVCAWIPVPLPVSNMPRGCILY